MILALATCTLRCTLVAPNYLSTLSAFVVCLDLSLDDCHRGGWAASVVVCGRPSSITMWQLNAGLVRAADDPAIGNNHFRAAVRTTDRPTPDCDCNNSIPAAVFAAAAAVAAAVSSSDDGANGWSDSQSEQTGRLTWAAVVRAAARGGRQVELCPADVEARVKLFENVIKTGNAEVAMKVQRGSELLLPAVLLAPAVTAVQTFCGSSTRAAALIECHSSAGGGA